MKNFRIFTIVFCAIGAVYSLILLNSCGGDDPVPAPSGLVVSTGKNLITITWDDVKGATSYNLYWSTNPGNVKLNGSLISDVTSPYTHDNLTQGITYYYVITAVNGGEESSPSEQTSITCGCFAAPNGIVSWWPGDEQGFDNGGGNNATLQGVSISNGKVGTAFDFDYSFDRIMAGSIGIKDLQQLTIETWVYHKSSRNSIEYYVALSNRSDTVGLEEYKYKAILRHDGESNPGQLHFYMTIDGVEQSIRVNDVLQSGTWFHIAGTYDGNKMVLYLDGIEVGNLEVSGFVGEGLEVLLGREYFATQTLDGLLDEVTIYDRALTAEEVASIYEADVAGKCHE